MRDKIYKFCSYALVIVLFAYYIFGLYEASRYDVSDEYRMFYIDRALKYYLPDGHMEQYGEDVRFEYKTGGNYKNQGKGWSHLEANSTWCIGNESVFYVHIDEVKEEYVLEMKLNGNFGYENEIFVNGMKIDVLNANEENICLISIPKESLKQGLNTFSIICKEEVKRYCDVNTNSTDTRELNLFVEYIELKSCEN